MIEATLRRTFLKTLSNIFHQRCMLLVLLCAAVFPHLLLAADKPYKLAVVPFVINAEKDMTFLKNGISDMLESRLALEGEVLVIDRQTTSQTIADQKGPIDEARARKIGAKLGADFLLFGSITVLGNNVSLDSRMVDISGEKPTLTFSRQSQGMDAIIPDIDGFANQINAKIFGRVIPAETAGAPAAAQSKPGYDIHAHPEKLIEGGFGDIDGSEGNTPGSAFIQMAGSDKSHRFWKSRDIRTVINGMDMGDVDGDDKIETVLLLPQEIHVYEYESKRFFRTAKIAQDKFKYYIGVDVADINGNGVAEIFVTALNSQRNSVTSFVMEWNGKTFEPIIKKSNYYYRVVNLAHRGDVLIGQKGAGDPFKGQVVELTWDGAAYVEGERLGRVRHNNLLGVAYGDVMNDGDNWLVAYNDADRIQILTPTGKPRWTASEAYGGNMMYFAGDIRDAGDIINPLYLPVRIRIADMDGDGKNEVITARNHDIAMNLLKNFRSFNKCHLESLVWDGIGLGGIWKTRRISGRISDFSVGDFDNDGKDELVASVVIKEGDIALTKSRSTIIAYELDQKKEEKKEITQ
jgi:TolB-like protein